MKLLIILYLFFLILFTFYTYLFVDINLLSFNIFYSGFSTQYRFLTVLLYILFLVAFYIFFFLILKYLHRGDYNYLSLIKFFLIQSFLLFFSYPAILSFDIFNYIFSAKVLYYYLENPYEVMPVEFVGDPYLLFTHAANKFALYGFAWLIISGIPFFVGFGNFVLTVFSFKLFVIIFYFLTTCLIFKRTKSAYDTSFFALNPLVLIEIFVSGHNDIVMMFLALAALYLLKTKKILLSLILMGFSVFIKYATILLLPLYLVGKLNFLKITKKYSIYYLGFFSMLSIFFISFLREEIYPWYAIWFMVFVPFIKNRYVRIFSIVFTFCLMLRYIPFMLFGTHFGNTPIIKALITFLLSSVIMFSIFFVERLCGRKVLDLSQ